MISFKNIKFIFKKEFLQILRDKSVLFTNFFIPLFGLPLYFILIIEAASYMDAKQNAPIKDKTIFKISYQGNIDKNLIKRLESDNKIEIVTSKSLLSENEINDYREKFENYKVIKKKSKKIKQKVKLDKEVLKANKEEITNAKNVYLKSLNKLKSKYQKKTDLYIAAFTTDKKVQSFYFFYSRENIVSKASLKYVNKIFKEYQSELVEDFKKKNNILKHDLSPFSFKKISLDKSNSTIANTIGIGLGGGILFLLLISIYNPTINTTIGERDQNTFKVLLMNPIGLNEIFIGKYLNVAFQGLLTLIPYAIEFMIFYAWGSSNFLFEEVPQLSGLKLLVLSLGIVSSAIFISALCFLVSSFAKTRVQAQSLLTLLMFCLMVPIGIISAMDIKLTTYSALVPIMNFPVSTENIMLNSPDYFNILVGIGVNLLVSLVLIWLSLGAFVVQWKGKSDTKGLSDLLTLKRRKSEVILPAHSFLAFAIAFLGYVYGGFIISTLDIDLFSYMFAPILFCLGTSFLILNYSGMDFTKSFNWGERNIFYSVRLIISAFVLSLFFNILFKDAVFSKLFKIEFPIIFEQNLFVSQMSYFLLFALIPGVVEEVLFRGVIFKGLRNQYSFIISSIVSSLMFSIIHFSMFKWGHTFFIGLLLAYVYEKRGLKACILFHIAFNTFGLLFGLNQTFSSLIISIDSISKVASVLITIAIIYGLVVFSRRSLKV